MRQATDDLRTLGAKTAAAARFGDLTKDGPNPIYVHHLLDLEETADVVIWADAATFATLDVTSPSLEVGRRWFAEAAGRPSSAVSLCGWAARETFDDAVAWLLQEARASGREPTGVPSQIVCSTHSLVMRVGTTAGDLYFKASVPEFDHEPALTRTLATLAPTAVPRVIATDDERGWLLTKDVGAHPKILDPVADLDVYERAVRTYAQLQAALAADIDRLAELGVPDRRPGSHPAILTGLLADTKRLIFDGPDSLTKGEYDQLQALIPEVATSSMALAGLGLPNTLVNTDFWRGNILVTESGPVLIDWAETAVANVMESLLTVHLDLHAVAPDAAPGAFDRLWRAHLSEWVSPTQVNELAGAWNWIRPLALIGRAAAVAGSVASLGVPERHPFLRKVLAVNLRRVLHSMDPENVHRPGTPRSSVREGQRIT